VVKNHSETGLLRIKLRAIYCTIRSENFYGGIMKTITQELRKRRPQKDSRRT